jgi:hypothetical protein
VADAAAKEARERVREEAERARAAQDALTPAIPVRPAEAPAVSVAPAPVPAPAVPAPAATSPAATKVSVAATPSKKAAAKDEDLEDALALPTLLLFGVITYIVLLEEEED